MTLRRLAPLLLLPVGLAAWGQAEADPSTGLLAGVGVTSASVVAIIAALVRRQEMGALILACADVVRGARSARPVDTCAETEVHRRVRHALGVQLDPAEPPPGVGLLVDVAKLQQGHATVDTRLAAVESELAGLRAAVEQGNKLLTEVLHARR